jgi:sec-independent protein translocase protein TatC
VSFEFPLLVVMLNLAGVLSFDRLRRWTRGIVFGVFAFAAVATPSQDPFTMLALAVPICLLFGAAMGFAYLHDRRKARREGPSLYEPVTEEDLAALDRDEPARP